MEVLDWADRWQRGCGQMQLGKKGAFLAPFSPPPLISCIHLGGSVAAAESSHHVIF